MTPRALDLCGIAHRPVRNQLPRGSCVAFALTACMEHAAPNGPDLSEQFLFWAIKQLPDDTPTREGSLLRHGCEALATFGLCRRDLHPYRNDAEPGDPGHHTTHPPSPAALADAQTRRTTPRICAEGGDAAAVYNAMVEYNRPVAITVPVFGLDAINNWQRFEAAHFGVVSDPGPDDLPQYLHAICVTGFAPDAREPGGGHFVFRNSWGPAWGWQLPSPNHAGIAPGYGQISATYLNDHLVEYCQL